MEEQMDVTPYRMGILTDLAGKIIKQMVSGTWHLTYEEMEVVLGIIQHGIYESREANRKMREAREAPFVVVSCREEEACS